MRTGTKVAIVVGGLALALIAFWRWGEPALQGTDSAGGGGGGTPAVVAAAGTDGPAAPLAAAPSPTAPARPVIEGPTVTGRILDAQGRPVPGARVVSVSDVNETTFGVEELGRKGAPAFGTTTDADGRFVVEVTKDALLHTVLADAPGHAITAKCDVAPGADVTISLDASMSLVGSVADSEGTPIVGARVRALWLVDTMKVMREAVTTEGGAYRIDDLVPGYGPRHPFRGYLVAGTVEVVAPGFAPVRVQNVATDGATTERRLDVTLWRGARLVGKVVRGDTGEPVGGATVAVCSTLGRSSGGRQNGSSIRDPYVPYSLGDSVTAADGTFAFENVPSRRAYPRAAALGSVVAWKTGFASAGAALSQLDDGAPAELELTLWPVASITGRVLESDGSPAQGAYASASVAGRGGQGSWFDLYPACPGAFTRSMPDGRFTLEAVPASATGPTAVELIVAAARSPLRRRTGPTTAEKRSLTLRAGETVDVGDVRLAPSVPLAELSVLVRSPTGGPVAGAFVQLPSSYMGYRSDASGVARVPYGESPAKPFSVRAYVRARGFAPTPVTVRFPPSSADPLVVVLASAHRLAGRVVVEDGTSAIGVWVSVGDGSEPVEAVFPPRDVVYPEIEIGAGGELPRVYQAMFVDAEGRFAFDDLPDGPYHVAAWRDRRVPMAAVGRLVRTGASGVTADSTDLVLRLPADDSPPTGSIVGRTTDLGTGKRLFDPAVTLYRDDVQVAGANSGQGGVPLPPGSSGVDETGLFTLRSLPVGTYRLVATAGDHRSAVVEGVVVRGGETTTLPPIALERGISVSGRVRGPEGFDWSGRHLELARVPAAPTSGPIRAALAVDGSFRTAGLEPGTYAVAVPARPTATSIAFLPANAERLVVGAGETDVRFDVTLLAAGFVALVPSDERLPPAPWDVKGPIPDAQAKFGAATRVTLRGPDGAVIFDRTGLTRNGGSNDWFLTLLPGRYVARIDFPDGAHAERIVDLAAGVQEIVTFGGR